MMFHQKKILLLDQYFNCIKDNDEHTESIRRNINLIITDMLVGEDWEFTEKVLGKERLVSYKWQLFMRELSYSLSSKNNSRETWEHFNQKTIDATKKKITGDFYDKYLMNCHSEENYMPDAFINMIIDIGNDNKKSWLKGYYSKFLNEKTVYNILEDFLTPRYENKKLKKCILPQFKTHYSDDINRIEIKLSEIIDIDKVQNILEKRLPETESEMKISDEFLKVYQDLKK